MSTYNLLKGLETEDYQNRYKTGEYPRSGIPDTILVYNQGKDKSIGESVFYFKNTSEERSSQWVRDFLEGKGFNILNIRASQDGDYHDDWVVVYCLVEIIE